MQTKPALSMHVIFVIGALAVLNIVQHFTNNSVLVAPLLWAVVSIALMTLLDAMVLNYEYTRGFRSIRAYGLAGAIVVLLPLTALAIYNPAGTGYGSGLLWGVDLATGLMLIGVLRDPNTKQVIYLRKYGQKSFAHGFDV
jgi:hypothetical protein